MYSLAKNECQSLELSLNKEWLLPNGIGGFAMGTASGINTRRYHGFLIASLSPPTDRVMLLPSVEGTATQGSNSLPLSSNQYPGAIHPSGFQNLISFEVSDQAVWTYKGNGMTIEKRLSVANGHNQCQLTYTNLGTKAVGLKLNPLVCHRDFHSNFSERENYPQSIQIAADETIVEENGVRLVLHHPGAVRQPINGWYYRFEHIREAERGLDPRDDLYCPCELTYELEPAQSVVLTASQGHTRQSVERKTEEFPPQSTAEKLKESALKFLVQTETRTSILAGYPWFSDWGRDTMIALPGICLHTGHTEFARQILRDYTSQLDQGLIPNRFVEKGERPDYNTVDASLWLANAVYKTLLAEWDEAFAREMLLALEEIVKYHQEGTYFGIKVDPQDGLLTQGSSEHQLTWMDAKIGDWVVTPRSGKPVEINGLWINLLRVTAFICARLGIDGKKFESAADQASSSFEKKFWQENKGYYLDTVQPDDAALRPNQVIAMSLPFSPCNSEHAQRALKVVEANLVTPKGLRTLAPSDPGYRGRFRGKMHDLDSAYHQGTVWPWLIGPYITSFVKYGGSPKEAREKLTSMISMLTESGLGGIAECYDGDEPRGPGGCPWQAWSVAEFLRAWVEDAKGD